MERSVNETEAQLQKMSENVNRSLESFQGAMSWILFSCVLCLIMSCCCTCLSVYGTYQHLYGVKKVNVTNFEREQEALRNDIEVDAGAEPVIPV